MITYDSVITALQSALTLWVILTSATIVLVSIDTILGIIIAFNPRLNYIRFSSTTLLQRLIKKIVFHQILILVACIIHAITQALPSLTAIANFTSFVSASFFIGIIIVGEVGSILENLKTLGVKVKIFGVDLTDYLVDKWLDALRNDD